MYGVWTVHTNTRSAKICSQINKKAIAETRDCVKWQMWKGLEVVFFIFLCRKHGTNGFLLQSPGNAKGPGMWTPTPPISGCICPEGHLLRHQRRQPDITHHLSNSSLPAKQPGFGVPPRVCLSATATRLLLALKESRLCVDEERDKFRRQAATKQNTKEIIEALYSHNALFQAETVGLFQIPLSAEMVQTNYPHYSMPAIPAHRLRLPPQ